MKTSALHPCINFSMMKTMEQLVAENEELKAKARSDAHLIELQKREIDHLADLVTFFRATRYAAKSEAGHSGQRELFNEAEHSAAPDGEEVEFEVGGQESKEKTTKKRPKRKPIPAIFKRVDRILDLPEEQKFCAHLGTSLRKVGEEISEKIDIVPASIQVIRTIRPKYACSCGFDDCKFHIAPVEPQAIPKGNASAGFLAYIATAKYSDHCPLNRQEEILQRAGIDLPRSTLASWMIKCGNLVTPLINLLRDKILESPLVFCDETHVQVLKGTQKKATSKSFMWVQAKWGGIGDRYVLYNFDPTRKASVAARLFDGYQGYVHADGYEGYSHLDNIPGITLVGDWVHVRRKFKDVIKASKVSEKAQLAQKGLDYIAALYKVESEIESLDNSDKLRIRSEKTRPIVSAMKLWADEQIGKTPPKSLIFKALNYFINQWPKLCYFIDDPIVGPDTNVVENAIRPFALGRRNWMFSDTVRGAEASANLFSLVITAKSNDIDPYEYLKFVFTELPKAKTVEDIERLLPERFPKTTG